MVKMKSWFAVTLVAMLFAGLLSACSGGGSNEGTNGNTAGTNKPAQNEPAKSEPVKLKFWGGVPAEAGPQAIVDAWNAQNKDIQVEYERFVNDDPGNLKLDTALMTGQDADLFVNYAMPRLKQRVEAGLALDLSALGDYNIDDMMGPDAKLWQVDGKYYGMPTTKNMAFFWLNKDMLDKANLPIPPLDWTWDDVRTYAKKLKETGTNWGLLQHEAVFMAPFDGTLAAIGTTKADGKSNLDNPLMKAGFQNYYDLMFTDQSTPPYGEQITSKMPVDTMFLKGEAGMLNAGLFIFRNSNNLKDNPRTFKIAFAAMPRISKNDSEFKYPGGLGDVISINAKSPNKEAAWKFLKWYADGGMLPVAAGGRIPASKAVNKDEALNLMLKGVEDLYDKDSLMKVVFGEFPTYVDMLDQKMVDMRREEFEKFFLKQEDLDTALANMVKKHNEALGVK
ncbi:ABC transporter substrate-binding protein [Paenibacillus beijingensis]|uniref:ABC transporter substrate-binding protein n=1 Tax=Paenibacillus beijingensis TaxID=1126833 RepID=A0A0D5NNB8_9BACL|nr:extracellular solute-binding protein [Paenibacillus beijingensis]AJY76512.1 ABC transporter substrate-binding protein [Paenibacillus beijingensis]